MGAHAERSPRLREGGDSSARKRQGKSNAGAGINCPKYGRCCGRGAACWRWGWCSWPSTAFRAWSLPASQKYLFDNVFAKHQTKILMPLVGAVLLATLMQGVTSYALTQLLSKAAQRMITELRRKVQEHVGRLPVAYYDANKTGALVSRIMSDVEGVRNLIGTGLVEFLGGLLTASIALVLLLRISPVMTGVAFALLLVEHAVPAEGVRNHPADFPRAVENQRRGQRAAHRIALRRARGEGLPRGGARTRGVHAGRAAPARQRSPLADHDVDDELLDHGAAGRGRRAGHADRRARNSGRHI